MLKSVQSALHFTSLTDLFTQTPSRLLWEASSHMLQLMRKGCSYSYPPLSIARYSFIKLSELEQCRMKHLLMILTPQHRIRTRVLVVESPKLCAIARPAHGRRPRIRVKVRPTYRWNLSRALASRTADPRPNNSIVDSTNTPGQHRRFNLSRTVEFNGISLLS